MKECWSFNADDRPSFGSLLEQLEQFQDKCAEMTDLEIAQLSPTAIDGEKRFQHFILSNITFTFAQFLYLKIEV